MLRNPNLLQLDFNALAQGYTVDVIAAFLDSIGLQKLYGRGRRGTEGKRQKC